jgi:cell division transport system permease protein
MEKITRKKTLGGYPGIGVVVSIVLALFVIGLFGILIIYSQELERQVRGNIHVQVYLKSNVTETQRLQIENKLLSQDYVNKESGTGIKYVSKDEAAKKFIAETGEDFTEFIGENPLRAAYLISINPAFHTEEQMAKIKADIQKMNGVFQVYYVETVIKAVNNNVTQIGYFLAGLTLVLLLTVILLINNTLKLALFSQRFLIRSMQLVGAKGWFIQRPFLVRGAIYGLLAGVITSVLLSLLSDYAQRKITDLALLHNQKQFFTLMILLIAIGITVSVIGTFFSMRKYLRMSLDELY